MSVDECVTHMKEHVGDPTTGDDWMSKDTDAITEHYSNFLQALAPLTDRLTMPVLKKAMMHLWECNIDYADLWASKLIKAFAAAKRTASRMHDGSRLQPGAKAVAVAMKEKYSPSPSPSPSPPACRVKTEPLSSEVEQAVALWKGKTEVKQEIPSPAFHYSSSSSSGSSELAKAMAIWGTNVKTELEEKQATAKAALHCMQSHVLRSFACVPDCLHIMSHTHVHLCNFVKFYTGGAEDSHT